MNIITKSLQKYQNTAQVFMNYVRTHSKEYLVGLVIIGALGIATYINSNLEETYTIRSNGGRKLANDIAEPIIQQIDPVPFLRHLAKMINSR